MLLDLLGGEGVNPTQVLPTQLLPIQVGLVNNETGEPMANPCQRRYRLITWVNNRSWDVRKKVNIPMQETRLVGELVLWKVNIPMQETTGGVVGQRVHTSKGLALGSTSPVCVEKGW